MSKNELHQSRLHQNLTHDDLDQLFAEETQRFVERFSDNIGSSSIGKLLEIIAGMPAIREEKVFDIRRQLSEERYDLDARLESAMERVFEEYLI